MAAEANGNGKKRARAEGPGGVVDGLIDFLNEAWTPFHATLEAKRLLLAAGYQQLSEVRLLLLRPLPRRRRRRRRGCPLSRPSRARAAPAPPPSRPPRGARGIGPAADGRRLPGRRQEEPWALEKGGRYFFTRNMSSVVAFAVGQRYRPGNGFVIVGAHTDSPCPKLKPNPHKKKGGCITVGCQSYGGGIWHTWFDRDLGVAGRVIARGASGEIEHKLVKIEQPIMRIPSLAIHLDREVNSKFGVNFQEHMAPVLAVAANKTAGGKEEENLLMARVAAEVGCEAEDILDFELQLCDVQPSTVGGLENEFIFSGRLDNLCNSYLGLKALLDSTPDAAALAEEPNIRSVALFDHEECGSVSAQGAGSSIMAELVRRVSALLCEDQEPSQVLVPACRRSFLVSADMAHALHPNYQDKHCANHAPKFHDGVVVKHNANQRYATNSVTATLFREIGKVAGVPVQEFVVRADLGCGSTIGPSLSADMSVRTVDVGLAQLSMHSIREMCGTKDVEYSYEHFRALYEHFSRIDATLNVD